jgi:hypothetical protein
VNQWRRKRGVGRLTERMAAQLHVKPDFLVVGGGRCGSSALIRLIRTHPNVMKDPPGELRFFDHAGSFAAYRREFPYRWQVWARELAGARPTISGEKTPSYLLHKLAPQRVRRKLPQVRLIALLREPAARAVSTWNLTRHHGTEARSFEQALADELGADWRRDPEAAGERVLRADREGRYAFRSYVRRGLYLPQLQRWHAQFPKEQLLILETEQFFRDTAGTMAEVHAFLGIPARPASPMGPRRRAYQLEPVDESILRDLRALFRPQNERLADYLGRQFSWT